MDSADLLVEILMRIWNNVVLLVLLFCLAAIPILGLGIGLGYGLHAVIPGLDLNWAIVAGAVFSVGIWDMLMRFMTIAHGIEQDLREKDDEDEEQTQSDEPWVVIPRKSVPPGGERKKK